MQGEIRSCDSPSYLQKFTTRSVEIAKHTVGLLCLWLILGTYIFYPLTKIIKASK